MDSHSTSKIRTSSSIDIEEIKNKLERNESLENCMLRGNSFEVTIGSKNNKNLNMCIYINNNIMSSYLRLDNLNRNSDSELEHFNYKKYLGISEIEKEITRLQKIIIKVN